MAMSNFTVNDIIRGLLKDVIKKLTDEQIIRFKEMYSFNELDLGIDEIIDQMEPKKLNHAVSQVQRTLNKNIK